MMTIEIRDAEVEALIREGMAGERFASAEEVVGDAVKRSVGLRADVCAKGEDCTSVSGKLLADSEEVEVEVYVPYVSPPPKPLPEEMRGVLMSTFADMLENSPIRGLDVEFERQKDYPREVDFG